MTFLFRNLTTEVVHTPECRSAGYDTARWNWANDKSIDEVQEATETYPWLHLCRRCLPGQCRCGKCSPAVIP